MVIVVDDADRENEGDLVIAAELTRPQDINFMISHARGLVCLALSEQQLQQLELPDMVIARGELSDTAFTVSIDLDTPGCSGISAFDRAATVRRAISSDAGPSDFRRPGHVFPLRARPGGLRERRGHTEAGVELARLAGLRPGAVLCEILAQDGSVARGADLQALAVRFDLPIVSVDDLARSQSSGVKLAVPS